MSSSSYLPLIGGILVVVLGDVLVITLTGPRFVDLAIGAILMILVGTTWMELRLAIKHGHNTVPLRLIGEFVATGGAILLARFVTPDNPIVPFATGALAVLVLNFLARQQRPSQNDEQK